MKLRIKGTSIRLRLTQREVARLGNGDSVEEVTRFPGGVEFAYRVQGHVDTTNITATFDGTRIDVRIAPNMLRRWCASTDVTISGQHEDLSIAVEKDFACLKPRENEDESDQFPHPLKESVREGC